MPLLLYPVLSLIFNKLLVSQFNPSTAPIDILVGFESELQANEFMSLVQEGEAALSAMGIAAAPETRPQFKLVEAKEAEIAVKDGIIDVGIFQNDLQSDAKEETSNPIQNNSKWELIYRPNSLLGDQAASYFEDRLNALNNGLTLQLLKMRGLPEKLPANFEIRTSTKRWLPRFHSRLSSP